MTVRIAILGGGVMGETLARGFAGALEPAPRVVIVEKSPDRIAALAAAGDVEVVDARAALGTADVVVLAVKPQDVVALLAEVGDLVRQESVVISIAAGITTSAIEARIPAPVAVVRAMPNTPARVGLGVTGVSPGSSCPPDALALAVRLLGGVGLVVEVPEGLQDAVTAVSGSGPAYVFLLAEAMISAASDLGLDPVMADEMVRGTILGAATLLASSADSAQTLRRNVTSPNGTTDAAIAALESAQVREAFAEAIAAARDRSRELSGG